MMPASNRGVGSNIGFPDPCLTPTPVPVPIPYPNIGMNAQATPFSATVRICLMSALNTMSKITMTSGMEGGVSHPMLKGTGSYTMGNPFISIEKMPAINLLCPTTGNNYNNPAGATLVPSLVNVFFTHVGTESAVSTASTERLAAEPPSPEDLERLRRPTVTGSMKREGVGYVAIDVFGFSVPTLLHNEVTRLVSQGMRSMVLDLRDNPGGELDAFLRLADDFLSPGAALATAVDGDGDEIVHRARHADPYPFPLVLLVNGRTGSAAELFAGCLKDHGRAVIVGETTHGKGVAQALVGSGGSDGASYATVAKVRLPGPEEVQGRGVTPDVERKIDDEQLQTALEIAKDLVD
jgi:carboxyl-terminal processing protease